MAKSRPWTAEQKEALSRLLEAFPDLAGDIRDLAYGLLDCDETPLADRLLSEHGGELAAVLSGEDDLQDLRQVLDDGDRVRLRARDFRQGEVLAAFVRAKADTPKLLRRLLPGAPGLAAMLLAERRLAVRLLCLGDSSLAADLRKAAQILEALVKEPADAAAMVELSVRLDRNAGVSPGDVLQALPALGAALASEGAAGLFTFVSAYLDSGERVYDINTPEWISECQARLNLLSGLKEQAPRWMVSFLRYQDLMVYASPWLDSEESAQAIKAAFEAIYGQSYGYSDRELDMKRMIPSVFRLCAPLVRSHAEFLRLCAVVPEILRALPEESESTMIGWIHYYDTEGLEQAAGKASDLAALLRNYETVPETVPAKPARRNRPRA